jgi:hypothetical protein
MANWRWRLDRSSRSDGAPADQAARRIAAARLPGTPELAATLQQGRDIQIPSTCSVGWVSYGGDEAGIVCRLEFEHDTDEQAFASITYLRFDARLALAREIAAYQKHRVKRLRRQPA